MCRITGTIPRSHNTRLSQVHIITRLLSRPLHITLLNSHLRLTHLKPPTSNTSKLRRLSTTNLQRLRAHSIRARNRTLVGSIPMMPETHHHLSIRRHRLPSSTRPHNDLVWPLHITQCPKWLHSTLKLPLRKTLLPARNIARALSPHTMLSEGDQDLSLRRLTAFHNSAHLPTHTPTTWPTRSMRLTRILAIENKEAFTDLDERRYNTDE
jgi:hypothetical protein